VESVSGLSMTESARVMQGMCAGISYMQSHGVVHRDLKPDNILYSGREANSIVKLIDFGFARMLPKKGERKMSLCGTVGYAAPEVRCGSMRPTPNVPVASVSRPPPLTRCTMATWWS
jgi:serine/threonine protein kinase